MIGRALHGLLLLSVVPTLPGCLTVALWSTHYQEILRETVRADVVAIRRVPPDRGEGPETIVIRFERTGDNIASPYAWAQRIPAAGCVRIETRERALAAELDDFLRLAARNDVTLVSATATFPVTLESDGVVGESVQLAIQYRIGEGALRVAACNVVGRCRVSPGEGPEAPAPLPLAGGTSPFAIRFNRSVTRSNVVLLSVLTPFTLSVDIAGTVLLAWLWWEAETADEE